MKIVKERLFEDIPDSYYQRNFGVMSKEDDTAVADNGGKVVAKVWDWYKKKSSPIVMNPNAAGEMDEYDDSARAIIDEYGNLYAAVKDGNFNHGLIGNALMDAGLIQCKERYDGKTSKGGIYAEPSRFVTCHYDGEYVVGGESMRWEDTTKDIIDKMLEKNPNVELGNDMYENEWD